MKEQILKLRSEGKTYKQIKDITGASKSTISYYCGVGQKDKTLKRNRKRRKKKGVRDKEYEQARPRMKKYNDHRRLILCDSYIIDIIKRNKIKVSIPEKKKEIMTIRINKLIKKIDNEQ